MTCREKLRWSIAIISVSTGPLTVLEAIFSWSHEGPAWTSLKLIGGLIMAVLGISLVLHLRSGAGDAGPRRGSRDG